MRAMITAAMLLAAPFISRAASAATFPSPGGWPKATPASVGLNAGKLAEAQRYAQRWDGASVHDFDGTYGDYVLGKVGKVFPDLKQQVL